MSCHGCRSIVGRNRKLRTKKDKRALLRSVGTEKDKMIKALSSPYKIKDLDLPNRFAMAPMTRKRSPDGVPTSIAAEYYHRRAAGGVGLLITEGTVVEQRLAADSDQIPRIAEEL